MSRVEWIQREGCNYHYRCQAGGVAIDDDRTGTWTTVHTQWHTTVRVAGREASAR